ncbi:hypothetical protein PC116_g30811 [Phytophthora cactorum]|nr:hypothetical protein PC116_g30811 [Phytophthora cactorum]
MAPMALSQRFLLGVIAKILTPLVIVRAAAKADVPYILPNWFGHDAANDALCEDSMLKGVRDSITSETKSLGVSSYILVVCNFWYEFSWGGGPDRFGFDFNKRTFVVFGDGTVPVRTSTWPPF